MVTTSGDIDRLNQEEIKSRLLDAQDNVRNLELENARLRESLTVLENSFLDVPLACLLLNEEGLIKYANRIAIDTFSAKLTETPDVPVFSLFDNRNADFMAMHFNDLLQTDTTQSILLRLEEGEGRFRAIDCRMAALLNDGGERRYVILFNDITAHKDSRSDFSVVVQQLEDTINNNYIRIKDGEEKLQKINEELTLSRQQLLEREAKLNSILNASIEGIIVIDTRGTIVSVNSAVERIFGYEADELIGQSVSLLVPYSFRMKKQSYLEKYLRIFVPKAIGQIREVEGLRRDGVLVPLDMTIAEFPLDGLQYYSGIVRDVSARKLQEQQEKEHLEKLAHVTRLGLMGEMASGIAHEVNQPLSAVVNYTKVCLNLIQNGQPDLEKLSEILSKANLQALKAGQIIHSMREFVKPRKIHRSTVDINELISDAIGMFESDFKQHLIDMRFEFTKTLPHVFIDRVQIEQVVLNLIRNSIDALKELPQFTQRKLSIETSLNDVGYIVVRVKDNGPGLSSIQREKILTPFFTTKASGMGMGLSISRSLVEAHHGTLHFNSKEDKGTTFYFTLPTGKLINDRN